MVQRNRRRGGFQVNGDGRGIESRAGLALPVEVADWIGLTDALSTALREVRSWRDHDPRCGRAGSGGDADRRRQSHRPPDRAAS